MHFTPTLRSFPKVAYEMVPMFVLLTMALSHPFKEDHLALPLSTSFSSRWLTRDVLGFVPAGSVSSFLTLKIFPEASNMWRLLCPPVYLLGHFPSLWHVQGSTPTGVFEGGWQPLTFQSGLPIQKHSKAYTTNCEPADERYCTFSAVSGPLSYLVGVPLLRT